MARISSADIASGGEPVDDVPVRLTGWGRFRGSLLKMPPAGATASGSGPLQISDGRWVCRIRGTRRIPARPAPAIEGSIGHYGRKPDPPPRRGVTAGAAGITLGGTREARASPAWPRQPGLFSPSSG